jgi:hypothetical protein
MRTSKSCTASEASRRYWHFASGEKGNAPRFWTTEDCCLTEPLDLTCTAAANWILHVKILLAS